MDLTRWQSLPHKQKPGNKTGQGLPFARIVCALICLLLSSALHAEVIRLPTIEAAPQPNILGVEVGPVASNGVTIEQLQQMARVTNPTLVQAAARVRALRGTKLQAGLYPNPSLGWVAEEMGNGGRAGRQGIGFTQEIVTGNKLGLSRATASRAVWAAEAQFHAQQLRVENDVRITAIAILASQERIDILEKLVKISEDDARTTEQLFNAKEVSRSDVLKAVIEANRTSLALHVARRNYLASWQKLAGILGRPEMQQISIEGTLKKNFPVLTWEASLARLLTESPLLEETEARISQAGCNLRRQCAERKSNLQVGAVVAYNNDSEYTEATLEVMVPLKIHDRNQGNIMRARAELMIAQQERDRLCLVLHNRLAQAFREYNVAQTEVAAYRETLLPKAKASLKLTKEGFRQSELSYLELLNSQQTLFSISLDYIDSLERLWRSATEIKGLLLTGGLEPGP